MAHAKDKWVRRFLIPETTRHGKGFTIYKVTSVVYSRSSCEEASKVSVWKRYNDFKRLHSELSTLYLCSQSKEPFPPFAKPKFFGRFEVEIIEERRQYALKLLDFVSRHACLYSSNAFINFFETSHRIDSLIDCSVSISSDTSEDDHNNALNSSRAEQNIGRPLIYTNDYKDSIKISTKGETAESNDKVKTNVPGRGKNIISDNLNIITVNDITRSLCNSTCQKDLTCDSANTEKLVNSTVRSQALVTLHDGTDLLTAEEGASCYILIAAAHMSAAFRHEAIAEYEEAFTQYKMGISNLLNGVQSDPNVGRVGIIKEKISKYLARAERLYNRHLNCNVSMLRKPVLELQYYKVLQVIKPVMLVEDTRTKSFRIVKTIERPCNGVDSIINYILRGQIPYMVKLYACIETDTTIFLVLQYVRRGKLWNFIKLHHGVSAKSQSAKQHSHSCNCIASIQFSSGDYSDTARHQKEQGPTPASNIPNAKNTDFDSKCLNNSSTGVEGKRPMVERKYGTAVPDDDDGMSTAQLLAKAQKLLQSVNATLKKSNSIANRLNESEHLLYDSNNTGRLNITSIVSCDGSINDALDDTVFESEERSSTETDDSKYFDGDAKGFSVNSNNNNNNNKNNRGHTEFAAFEDTCTNVSNQRQSCRESSSVGQSTNERNLVPHPSDASVSCGVSAGSNVDAYTEEKTILDKVQWQIPEATTRLWAAEILLALEALHQQEVIIVDLNPDNLLLDDSGHVLLTYITPQRNVESTTKFKEPYSAPELSTFSPPLSCPAPSADIWSFGIILYELLTGIKFQWKHYGTFRSHSTVSIPSGLSHAAKSLLSNVLKYEPCDRLTIPKIKQHPFFEDVDWSNLVNP